MWLSLALSLAPALADEGMWTPEQLPTLAGELSEMGLELSAEQLADPLAQPLGAIISLGGCSASFISADGLVATNHHCATGYLQYVSDAETNRAELGFLAGSREQELSAGPTARLYVVDSITDVTDRVLKKVRKRTPDGKRHALVQRARKELVAECEATPDRRCEVAAFYEGSQYKLIRKLELRDVRLVYAPPDMVGNYGDEEDNWMWPRHSGDFTLLRGYVAPDGSSADYSEDNVPYTPPHHLKIDPSGANPGDFVMVAGYPGGTYRYRPGAVLRAYAERGYPYRIGLYEDALTILRDEAANSEEARARLMSPIGMVANGEKYSQGIIDGVSGSGVIERREADWEQLVQWVAADPKRQRLYGPALVEMAEIQAQKMATYERDQVVSWLLRGVDLLGVSVRAYRFSVEAQKPDLERDSGYQERDLERTKQRFERLDKSLWQPADQRLATMLFERSQTLSAEQRIPPVDAWIERHGGIEAAVQALFSSEALLKSEARLALLEQDRATLESSEDPWIQFAVSMETWKAQLRAQDKVESGALMRVRPMYMQALLELKQGRVYPDANSTLRLTVGHVKGYEPRDAVVYSPQTTVAGIVEKAGDWPYAAPPRVLEGAGSSSESRWVDEDLGDVPVNFLTTLDTTGGNSGSATLNARGELVGLIFDGNYESMSADWVFDPVLTRSIHVDVRYMLWLLDEVEHADWILHELGLGDAG